MKERMNQSGTSRRTARVLAGLLALIMVITSVAANALPVRAADGFVGFKKDGDSFVPITEEYGEPEDTEAVTEEYEEPDNTEEMAYDYLVSAYLDDETGEFIPWIYGISENPDLQGASETLGQALLSTDKYRDLYGELDPELPGTWSGENKDVLEVYPNGSALVAGEGYTEVIFTYAGDRKDEENNDLKEDVTSDDIPRSTDSNASSFWPEGDVSSDTPISTDNNASPDSTETMLRAGTQLRWMVKVAVVNPRPLALEGEILTAQDLQDAIDKAEAGAVIELTHDIVMTGVNRTNGDGTNGTKDSILIKKPITLTSADPANPVTIKRGWTDEAAGKFYSKYLLEVSAVKDSDSIGSLTLENIILDGGSEEGMSGASIKGGDTEKMSLIGVGTNSKSGNKVNNYKTVLTIGNGTVLRNNNKLNQLFAPLKTAGGAVYSCGHIIMNGGLITNCTAAFGGGVYIEYKPGRSQETPTFEMNGGEIKGNIAGPYNQHIGGKITYSYDQSGGGGVLVYGAGEMTLKGGVISGNEAAYGGGIALNGPSANGAGYDPPDDLTEQLIMEGGTIGGDSPEEGNTARINGGGIYIHTKSAARITGGVISYNEAGTEYAIATDHRPGNTFGKKLTNGYYGGGGIYVNGLVQNSLKVGYLKVYNVEISDNTAQFQGGGIAGCPASNVMVSLTSGGVIYDNTGGSGPNGDADYSGQEIFITNSRSYSDNGDTKERYPKVNISPSMLGGGSYDWKDSEGNPIDESLLKDEEEGLREEVAIYSGVTAEDETVKTAVGMATTHITHNISHAAGGGIGTNGDLQIGSFKPGEEYITLYVKKVWVNDFPENRPKELTFRLYRDEETEPVEKVTVPIEKLSRDSYTPLFTVKKYRIYEEGKTYTYRIEEDPEDGYESLITTYGDNTKWEITNTAPVSLKLEKKVKGEVPADAEFSFDISLRQADGTLFEKVDIRRYDGATETKTFTDGKITVTLKADESLQLMDLPKGTQYVITETSTGAAAKVTVDKQIYGTANGVGHSSEISEGTEVQGTMEDIRQAVVYTNAWYKYMPVQKVWRDWDGSEITSELPESITVKLLQNGDEYRTGKLTSQSGWKYTFEDLDIKDPEGNDYVYSVKEEGIEGWKSVTEGNADKGYTITNTRIPPDTSRSVIKVWDDDGDSDGLRPESVMVQLKADGEPYGEPVELNKDNDWGSIWTELPSVHEDGTWIRYSLEELTSVDGYTSEVTYSEDIRTYTVTNTHVPEPTESEPDESKPDESESSEPAPTEPAPTEPIQPTQPGSIQPTEPARPSEPAPTQPVEPTPTQPAGPGTVDIVDEGVPLNPMSVLTEIEDEDVPLAFLAPLTGDDRPVGAAALFGLIALGMMGAFGILASKKDEEDAS